MDSVFSLPENCCGCALCEDVCPKNAITMVEKEGFLYPSINQKLCVDCGLCAKKCPFKDEKKIESNCLEAYAVKHKNSEVVVNSSSGGIFTALSDRILSLGGFVIGADFDSDMNVHHIAVSTSEERDRMRGSKYIQSNSDGIYKEIKKLLNEDKYVLFTGTPCQAAAVRKAFPDQKRLYIVDIICHGVPSAEVWKKYVAFVEKKYGKKLSFFSFRDKSVSGWRGYSAKLTFDDKTELSHNDITGSFIELFRYDVCLRPSCTKCSFTSTNRPGDITIGDFWGIENVLPEVSDNKGVSAVMINTEKGKQLFEEIREDIKAYPCSQADIAKRQPNLSAPSSHSNKAEAFQKDLKGMPFNKVLKKYTRVGVKRRIIDKIKKVIGR